MSTLLLLLACAGDSSAPLTEARTRAAGVTHAYDALPAGADLDAGVQALFVPDDPVNTLEVALIDEVTEACLAASCDGIEPANNPFSIRYAVYNLRNPDIVEALVHAHDAGVFVQVLIEQDQLDPARDWNTADETLLDVGFSYAWDHRDLNVAERERTELIGVAGSGLMHLKTRLYQTPEHTRLLTGSLNPGDNAVYNDETLHLVNEPALVSAYADAYEAVLADVDPVNTWDDAADAHALFTPASGVDAGETLFDWLEAEDEQILLMVYSLRDLTAPGNEQGLVELLADKVDAGVEVVVVTDVKQSTAYGDDTASDLRDAGCRVYEVTNPANPYTAMHHKVAVLGRSDIRVITDAANWTSSGLGSATRSARNVESVLFFEAGLDDGRTGRRYLAQVVRVLESYADTYGPLQGEPGFSALLDELMADGDWPTEEVVFSGEVETSWGENAGVRGELDVLGAWGPGLTLSTDEDRYPLWTSEPVSLPVGVPFAWKLVAGYDDANVRWEAGEDRHDAAMAPTLLPDVSASIEGRWRD